MFLANGNKKIILRSRNLFGFLKYFFSFHATAIASILKNSQIIIILRKVSCFYGNRRLIQDTHSYISGLSFV